MENGSSYGTRAFPTLQRRDENCLKIKLDALENPEVMWFPEGGHDHISFMKLPSLEKTLVKG